MIDSEAFITKNTRLQYTSLVPEIRLFLRDDNMLKSFLKQEGIHTYPSWAYTWPGGLASARYILDNDIVSNKTIIDYCSGSGIVGIAAKLAGAKSVICVDIDPLANISAKLNARANNVEIHTDTVASEADLLLAGDPALQESIFDYIKTTKYIVGCPQRNAGLLLDMSPICDYQIESPSFIEIGGSQTVYIFR